ncbi:MAG: DUF2490 domain-containing protein [Candidatus Acidiferrales bacterium]
MSGEHRRKHRGWVLAGAALLLLLGSAPIRAQTKQEFWPGFDAYIKLKDRTRLYFLAAGVRDQDPASGQGRDVTLGAHLGVSLKPVLRRKLAQKSDWERQRYLWARVGYQHTTSVGGEESSREHRGILELTGRLPLPKDFWVAQRMRVDLRGVNGEFSTRPRFRLQAEREVRIFRIETVPYVNAEIFYDTRYDTLNRHRYQAGVEVVLNQHWRVEPYFTRQHDAAPAAEHQRLWFDGEVLPLAFGGQLQN